MKTNILSVAVLLLVSLLAIAQPPQGVNYQAVARDGNDNVISNSSITVRFSINKGTVNGTLVYQEEHNVSTNQYGLFNVVIGNGTPLQGSFSNLQWGTVDYYLKIEVDNGNGFQDMGSSQLQSVPYSLYSEEAATVSSMPLDSLSNVEIGNASNGDILKWNSNNQVWENDTSSAGGSGGDNDWMVSGNQVYNSTANVGIGVTNPSSRLEVSESFAVKNSSNQVRAGLAVGSNDQGALFLYGSNGTVNAGIASASNNANNGLIEVYDQNGNAKGAISVANGAGTAGLRGANGNNMAILSGNPSNNPNYGALALLGSQGNERVDLSVLQNDNLGLLQLNGQNGNANVRAASLANNNNHGSVAVYNSSGTAKAGIAVNSSGDGEVFGDTKNFRIDHPTKPNKEIWYASLEGPEAAAYVRGTAELKNGEATIDLPEHFSLIVQRKGMTVNVTPHSRSSQGLAIVEKGTQQIKVAELRNGKGNYKFDWEVKGVRKRHSDYKVIREKRELSNRKDQPSNFQQLPTGNLQKQQK